VLEGSIVRTIPAARDRQPFPDAEKKAIHEQLETMLGNPPLQPKAVVSRLSPFVL